MTRSSEIFNKTERETGTSRVYRHLKSQILQLDIEPGARLDEISLSQEFGVSRSPVREALIRLSGEGLVLVSPNRTATVAAMDLGRTAEFLDAMEILQRIVTRLAAVNRSALDLDRMRQAQSVYEKSLLIAQATSSVSEMIEADYAFHIIVATACKNSYFIDLYRKLLLEAQRMLHLHYMLERCNSVVPIENLANDHLEIIDAIANEDSERAEIHAQKHADHFRKLFMQLFNRRITWQFSLKHKTKISKLI